jgi:subtilisin family serine protease
VPNRYFIELAGAPAIRGRARAAVMAEHDAFRVAAARAGVTMIEEQRFTTVWNGLSVTASPLSLIALVQVPGVIRVWPVSIVRAEPGPIGPSSPIAPPGPLAPGGDPIGGTPDVIASAGMIGADIVRSDLGFDGSGIRVGIIDSGIDYHHPDLGGCFGPGCRVRRGTDLVGDAFDAGKGDQRPVPDADPDDCGGHGTHVAGIVGADGAVRGVAPGVTFGAYRVFGCAGTTTTDLMVAAMDLAYQDGMRVVNMSIGSAFQWPDYPTAKAAANLEARGVVVTTSAGNSGSLGLFATGAPGTGAGSIAAAAVDNAQVQQRAIALSPGDTLVGFNSATAAPLAPFAGSLPLTRTGTTTTTNDACAALTPGSLTGQAVLIRRGTCSFYVKAANAQAAGAAAVLVYNNTTGALSPTVAGTPPITIPTIALTQADGVLVDGRIQQGGATVTWTTKFVGTAQATAGQISSFSSWGPTTTLDIKPEVTAPGGSILSTYPVELGRYTLLSGTSMASPHVAGAAALLLQAMPGVAPAEIRARLANTAVPALAAALPAPSSVLRQGAGLIHVDTAIAAPAVVTPHTLPLGEGSPGTTFTRTIAVRNAGNTTLVYGLSAAWAATVSGPLATPSEADGSAAATVTFTDPTITVIGGGITSFDVKITPSDGLAAGSLYSGYVVLTPQGGGPVLRVPYLGFAGDYQAMPVLGNTGNLGYPWLARPSGTTFTNLPNGGTFTLEGDDVPVVIIDLDRHARRLRLDVVDAAFGKPWGALVDGEFLGASTPLTGGLYRYRFTGVTTLGKDPVRLPNGSYRFQVRVLRPLGDEGNPAHWETWTSPVFTLNHP